MAVVRFSNLVMYELLLEACCPSLWSPQRLIRRQIPSQFHPQSRSASSLQLWPPILLDDTISSDPK